MSQLSQVLSYVVVQSCLSLLVTGTCFDQLDFHGCNVGLRPIGKPTGGIPTVKPAKQANPSRPEQSRSALIFSIHLEKFLEPAVYIQTAWRAVML